MAVEDLSVEEIQTLRRIADESALRSLVTRYFHGLDRRDGRVLASIYRPEGVERGDGSIVDIESHVSTLLRVGRFAFSHHITGSVSFDVEGDSASGDIYAVAFLVTDTGSDRSGRIIVRGLQYLDEYTRGPEGWRIRRRHGPIPLWQFEGDSLPPQLPALVLSD
jgi:hypothetical protein